MSLPFALLFSLVLHAALVVAPAWRSIAQTPLPTTRLEARLMPQADPLAMAAAVSTEADSPAAAIAPPPPPPAPRTLQGRALRRAQSALSEHLLYPPQAVAQGLEGDVVLLLILADGGRLISASIARSSGHALLDQAALDATRGIGALPGNPHQTLFPVSFRLN